MNRLTAAFALLLAAVMAAGSGGVAAADYEPLPGMPPGPPALARLVEAWSATPPEQRDAAAMERSLEQLLVEAERSGGASDRVVVLTFLALTRNYADDPAGTVTALDRAVALGTRYWFPVQLRGGALLALGRARDALADFDRALDLLPREAWPMEPGIRMARAASLRDLRRFGEAADDYRIVLEHAPKNLEVAYQRAIMHSLAGQKDVALRQIDDLLQRDPGNLALLRDRAEILMDVGRYLDARRSLDEALAMDARDPGSLSVRGRLAFLQGDFAKAAGHYADSFDSDLARGLPDSYTLVRLATARLRAGQPDPADSRRRRELAPIEPWAAEQLAHLLGDISAEALLARAREAGDELARDERLCEAHFTIGQKLLAEGRTAEAKRQFETVVGYGLTYFVENGIAKVELGRLP